MVVQEFLVALDKAQEAQVHLDKIMVVQAQKAQDKIMAVQVVQEVQHKVKAMEVLVKALGIKLQEVKQENLDQELILDQAHHGEAQALQDKARFLVEVMDKDQAKALDPQEVMVKLQELQAKVKIITLVLVQDKLQVFQEVQV